MKHCPNTDCPHAVSTGRPPEYDDHVSVCADCGTGLIEGRAPERTDDSVPLETIAEFPSPHEAHAARGALASHGIEAVVDQEHSAYISAASWVQLRVSQADAKLARKVLDGGPLLDAVPSADTEAAPADTETAAAGTETAPPDDMRPMRLSRRILLARWFLYAQAVGGFLAVPLLLDPPLLGLAALLLSIGVLALTLWSHVQPRPAFAVALVCEAIAATVMVAFTGPTGIIAFIVVLAVYFGWAATGDHPPERLQARPRQTRSAEVDIGEAWRETGPLESTTTASPRWKLAIGITLAVVALLVVGSLLGRSPLAQKVVRGSTAFELVGDPDAAMRQELELGLARLAHAMRESEIDYEVMGIVDLGDKPGIQLGGTPSAESETMEDLLQRLFPGWRVVRGMHEAWFVHPEDETRAAIINRALEETLAGIRQDFVVTVSDIDRTPQGPIRLSADIPGERSLDEIRGLLDYPTRLEMRAVRYPDWVESPSRWLPPGSREEALAMFGGGLPTGTELVPEAVTPQQTIYWPVERVPVIVGRDLLDASPVTDDFGSPAISFLLTPEAGPRLEAATARMVGMKMALILQEEGGASVVSVPVIQSVIGTQGIIQGAFTKEDARLIANRMLAGSRAMPLRVVGFGDEPEP